MPNTTLPLRQFLPSPSATAPAGSLAQQAFREAIGAVEVLREQLRTLRAAQAATRQAYWQQVGPLAAAAVAAHRALFEPLENALTEGYLNRAEIQQVTELLWQQAHNLQERFGENEAERLARYAPYIPPPPEPAVAAPELLPHEQAAAEARTRRQQQTQQAQQARTRAADTEGQALLQNTKAAYRQLARLHHPDRAAQADAQTQQTQTELMQRITAAYAAGDLAALLAILATETPTATAEADELLRQYTLALAQQQAQLRQQLTEAQRPTTDTPWSGTEKQQRTRLRQLKRDLRDETEYLGYLLRQVHEPATLRQVLRELAALGRSGF
ncbi:MAG: hypothetical protein ACRYFX_25005 [Janthinobacterium lividum]